MNLDLNAIEAAATSRRASRRSRHHSRDAEVELSVRDSGPGLSAEAQRAPVRIVLLDQEERPGDGAHHRPSDRRAAPRNGARGKCARRRCALPRDAARRRASCFGADGARRRRHRERQHILTSRSARSSSGHADHRDRLSTRAARRPDRVLAVRTGVRGERIVRAGVAALGIRMARLPALGAARDPHDRCRASGGRTVRRRPDASDRDGAGPRDEPRLATRAPAVVALAGRARRRSHRVRARQMRAPSRSCTRGTATAIRCIS